MLNSRCLIVLSFFMATSTLAQAQSMLGVRFPKVNVSITLDSIVYKQPNNIEVNVAIINLQKFKQKLLFSGKAWGLCGIVTDKQGKSVTELQCHAVLESQIYTETMLKKMHAYRYLKPDSSMTHHYHLSNILVLNFHNNQLPPGDYTLSVSYFGNESNKVSFSIN